MVCRESWWEFKDLDCQHQHGLFGSSTETRAVAHAPDVYLLLNVLEEMVSLGLGHTVATY